MLSGWLGLSDGQRKLSSLVAAGAGLAAVYNVPLGGALFTVEVLLGSTVLPAVLPAIGVLAGSDDHGMVYLPSHATYLDVPAYHLSVTLVALGGPGRPASWGCWPPPISALSVGSRYHRATGAGWSPAMVAAFGALGLIGFQYPQLFGNGKDVANDAFLGQGGLTLLLALFCLKPLVTAMCLRSGAAGGVFTPTLSTGALLGAFLGLAWSHLWPGAPVGAFAMVGAAAMAGAAMQAPLAGVVLVLELTHTGFALLVPMMAATVTATYVARVVDGYSIYSARLPAEG